MFFELLRAPISKHAFKRIQYGRWIKWIKWIIFKDNGIAMINPLMKSKLERRRNLYY